MKGKKLFSPSFFLELVFMEVLDYFKTPEDREKWCEVLRGYLESGEFRKPGRLFKEDDIRQILSSFLR